MDVIFKSVVGIEQSLKVTDTQQKDLAKLPKLNEFMEHCCVECRYVFYFKKCGKTDCLICKPPRKYSLNFTSFLILRLKKHSNDFGDVWARPLQRRTDPLIRKSADDTLESLEKLSVNQLLVW